MQRRRAAVITKTPEQSKNDIIILRRMGSLKEYMRGIGMARIPASVNTFAVATNM